MIKYFKTNSIIASLMWLGVFMLQACDDNESFDITGSSDNLAYIKIEEQRSANPPYNQLTYAVIQTPVGIVSNIKGGFPVCMLRAVEESVTIKVEQDNTLLDAYNAAYDASCIAVPDGLLDISNTTLTIERGATVSADSISFTANESMLSTLKAGQNYLLPLRVTTVSNNNVQISSNMSCAYVLISTKYQSVRENGGASDMRGTLISSYTGWTYSSSHTTGAIANLWTTSTSSRMNFTANPAAIIFDMQTTKKVTGVRIYPRNSSNASYRLSNAKLALSTDGVTFEDIADLTISQMAYASYYQYICMYAGIEAKYLKLELDFVTTETAYWSLVNLGVYAE